MNNARTLLSAWLVACGAASAAPAQPVTTAFTYQGSVDEAGQPASGLYDFRFRLYDGAGAQVGSVLCADNVTVADGRFSVALDFGGQFAGQSRYLEVEVRRDAGLSCGNPAGFTVLSPRQELTAAPHASYALNAGTLQGQPGSYYLNGANFTGTIPDARLSTGIPRVTGAQTFTGVNAFSNAGNTFTGSYSGSGAGLTALNAGSVGSGTLADARLSPNIPRLDGANAFTGASTFSGAGNSFTGAGAGLTGLNASALASGTVADARLSANIARLNAANAFTAASSFSANTTFSGNVGVGAPPAFPLDVVTGVQTAVNVVGGNTGGTWFNLRNTSGRQWQVISTGSANSEGAGKLLFRDGTANAVRMTLDTAGNVGVGTTSPAAPLDLALGDKRLQLRSDGGLVPGINLSGTGANLGTMRLRNALEVWPSDAGDRPGYLDVRNGSGVTTVSLEGATGRVNARNMPLVAGFQLNRDARVIETWDPIGPGENRTLATVTANVPSQGFLYLTAWININTFGIDEAAPALAYLKLSETTGGTASTLTEVAGSFDSATSSPIATYEMNQVVSLSWLVPTGAGARTFSTSVYTPNMGVRVGSRALTILYLPGGM